jgi:hypothetical protein
MSNLEKDLERALNEMSADWKLQDNNNDKETNFIYNINSFDELMKKIEETDVDKDYALHRWYNFKTSLKCEYIFCDYGAIHDRNIYNHDVDIYIKGEPFDVKLTVYPNKLSGRPYDLNTLEGREQMIQWFYNNQSQGGRKQMINRLFVVCDGDDNMKLKSDFALMRQKISAFMQDVKKNGLHQQVITDEKDGNKKYLLKTDLIYISK